MNELPQQAVGKSAKVIAEMLKADLEAAGIKLDKPAPIKDEKHAIWSVKSLKYADKMVVLFFSSRPRGGRGKNKPRLLSLSFGLFNTDGTRFQSDRMNHISCTAALTFEGAAHIYSERVL